MYRIRLHGRGGQGLKTAGRMLGTAFFLAGFEVQDAPRYGAERRGAPIFAYVRAARAPIHERGAIARPDLVVVADPNLVAVASAGVRTGLGARSVVLLCSDEPPEVWRERLRVPGPLLTVPGGSSEESERHLVGATCVGAAARLVGVLPREALERAIREELAGMRPEVVALNRTRALEAWERLEPQAGLVAEGEPIAAQGYARPAWVELPFEPADRAAPDIHAAQTSVEVRTGLWRTLRPVIDYERCHRCSWVCGTFCPDGVIAVDTDRTPHIDYDHCKGCLVCVAVCPPHAIGVVPEPAAAREEPRA